VNYVLGHLFADAHALHAGSAVLSRSDAAWWNAACTQTVHHGRRRARRDDNALPRPRRGLRPANGSTRRRSGSGWLAVREGRAAEAGALRSGRFAFDDDGGGVR
jgi:hypothetical protein